MRHCFHSWLSWCLVAPLIAAGSWAEAGTRISKGELEAAVREYIASRRAASTEQSDVVLRGAPEGIDVQGESYELHVASDTRTQWKGTVTVRVEVETGGRIVHRCLVSVVIRTYADVLVAGHPISRHAQTAAGDVTLQHMETTQIHRPLVVGIASLGGMRTRQIIPQGSILYEDLFESNPLVQQGDHVLVKVQSHGVALTTEGIAREDGGRGEYVSVELANRRERVRARIDGVQHVTVVLAEGKEKR
jgi:flagella basal body P-ring formation protein FlgA